MLFGGILKLQNKAEPAQGLTTSFFCCICLKEDMRY